MGAIKEKDQVVGNQTRVKVVKNKMAPPFKVVDFDILYGEGISKTGELLDFGVKLNLVEKSGSWYAYKGQKIGQGREAARQFLKENPTIANAIEQSVRQDTSGKLADLEGPAGDIREEAGDKESSDEGITVAAG